jgi:hypothetical protein
VPEGEEVVIPFLPLLNLYSRTAYSSTLRMEAAGSSETIIPLYQAVRRHIPEDGIIFISLIVRPSNLQ